MALWFLLRCVPAAHPRSRGEHVVQQRRADNAVGSSLLARGTQLSLHQHCIHVGLIPARAGNTLWRNCWAPARAAHPRSRREHTKDPVVGVQAPGSSPIARGAREIQIHMQRLVRLIPARAGSTKSTNSGFTRTPAHPRSRGEHYVGSYGSTPVFGSSPLARGTRVVRVCCADLLGLIPTRAGNTADSPPANPSSPAHPRSRGEHPVICQLGSGRYGSSPLARGTQAEHCSAQISSPSTPQHSSGQRYQR